MAGNFVGTLNKVAHPSMALPVGGFVAFAFSNNKASSNYCRKRRRVGIFVGKFFIFLSEGNNTSFYPSTFNLQHSLTIENSSSSHYTLTAMSYVSLFVPFVFAYVFYAWRVINKEPISAEELNGETHIY